MKKILSAFAFAFCILSVNFCSAVISPERCTIGGIHIMDSSKYVKSIYGEPDKIESMYVADGAGGAIPPGSTIYTWYYGNSFELTIVNYSNRKNYEIVIYATSTANNGLKTPDGVTVGMKENILYQKYGTPDDITEQIDRKLIRYDYELDTSWILFVVKNGVISSISVEGHF